MPLKQITWILTGLAFLFWQLPAALGGGPGRMVDGKPLSEWADMLMNSDEDASGQARDVLISAKLSESEFVDLVNQVVPFLADKNGYPYLAVGENLIWIIAAMGDKGRAGLPFIGRMADAPYESEAIQLAEELFGKLDQPLEAHELGAVVLPAKGQCPGPQAADVNGDQRDELILECSGPQGTVFKTVSPERTPLEIAWEFDAKGPVSLLYAGDINNDGRSELCCTSGTKTDQAVIYGFNNGPGPCLLPLLKPDGYQNVRFGVVRDFDHDRLNEVLEFAEVWSPDQATGDFEVRICRWNDEREKMQEILPRIKGLGCVKKVSCGDIDGDRQEEIVFESGPDTAGGEVAVIFYKKGGYVVTDRENLSCSDDPQPFLTMLCFDANQDGKDELIKLEDSGYYLYQWDGAKFKEIGHRWYDGTAGGGRLLKVRAEGKPDSLLLAHKKKSHDGAWYFRQLTSLVPKP